MGWELKPSPTVDLRLAPPNRARLLAGPSAVLAGGGAMLGMLLVFDPHAGIPYLPVCPFREVTGWDCPGCGGLRAIWSLIHGDVRAAWDENALVFFVIPALTLGLFLWFRAAISRRRSLRLPYPVVWLAVVLAIVWVITRNLWL
jgi:Protein of unknown function (DUF2752)